LILLFVFFIGREGKAEGRLLITDKLTRSRKRYYKRC